MPQFSPRTLKNYQGVLQVVRGMGLRGSNAGAITEEILERDIFDGLDRDTVYRRTLRALKALMEEGLVEKVGLNYVAREENIERELTRKVAEAVAHVASTSHEAADAGLLCAALLGVADDLKRSARRAKAPLVGKDLADQVLGE